ncbi:MAG: hypothetical protein CL537_15350 [Alcanivoracaceae bacterium]|nr:hypothetical protein [Alcanivoracaceae bacterium]PNE02021.1 hypothetical protein A15D_02436 [Alcanivorax sp. MD8A]|tara:strand:+ start:1391 stop:1846 length:456 start_codon:yes stop_codon:yes gene_type:complete
MNMELRFSSRLPVLAERLWSDITHMDAINAEMWPWLSMGAPDGVRSLEDRAWQPGKPLFGSSLKAFCCIPVGVSMLTLERLMTGKGFVEASPMTGMVLWRHERWLERDQQGCVVHDQLTFTPRWCPRLSRVMVQLFFRHRHRRLRRRYRQC